MKLTAAFDQFERPQPAKGVVKAAAIWFISGLGCYFLFAHSIRIRLGSESRELTVRPCPDGCASNRSVRHQLAADPTNRAPEFMIGNSDPIPGALNQAARP
jgi:hypothetical protein